MRVESVRPRILVSEDDEGVLDLIRTRLELAGYHTLAARDGFEALAAMADFRPAALVLDINMPRLDGFEVLRAMRKRPDLPDIPVLVLTARHATEDVRTAIALGARDFLAKPFQDHELLRRIARLTRRRAPN